jgi:hypothetical protein
MARKRSDGFMKTCDHRRGSLLRGDPAELHLISVNLCATKYQISFLKVPVVPT